MMEPILDMLFNHVQIGCGSGEDLVAVNYMLQRRCGSDNIRTLKDMHDASNDPEEKAIDDDSDMILFHGFDFDETALVKCQQNLKFASTINRFTCQDIFKLTDHCKHLSATSTACSGKTFFIQSMLYVLGGATTKYFICDHPSNMTALFEIVEEISREKLLDVPKLVVSACKTKKGDTTKQRKAYAPYAFHQEFMKSCIDVQDVSDDEIGGEKELTHRNLHVIYLDDFIEWVYRYLPPPKTQLQPPVQPMGDEARDPDPLRNREATPTGDRDPVDTTNTMKEVPLSASEPGGTPALPTRDEAQSLDPLRVAETTTLPVSVPVDIVSFETKRQHCIVSKHDNLLEYRSPKYRLPSCQ